MLTAAMIILSALAYFGLLALFLAFFAGAARVSNRGELRLGDRVVELHPDSDAGIDGVRRAA